jgi:two-component system, LytTR family, sensor kinase
MSDLMPIAVPALLVDLLGYLTGAALYAMLVVMVGRERLAEQQPFLSVRGRLPLLSGVCGFVWNVGALAALGLRMLGRGEPPLLTALTFAALGGLPAVVVHSLFQGRETAAGREVTRLAVVAAYGVSGTAAMLQIVAALRGLPVPSRGGLWLLTGGFLTLMALLLVLTRQQPIGRRGVWVAAMSIFAVSALHFGRHDGNESWWVELIGHHAALPLALAILLQDYRFALADIFLKNAIALLLLMTVSLALFAGVMVPLLRWRDATGATDPRAVALLVAIWLATAMVFGPLRRLANHLVDRSVLRRPDYDATLASLARTLELAYTEADVLRAITVATAAALGAADTLSVEDPVPVADRRTVLTGAVLRQVVSDGTRTALVRLPTVDAPHRALAVGPLIAGRRLLSDDRHLLEAMARLGTRRIDALRVAQERLERDTREQRMQQLASEAELRALRAQINPHFLFNALTTIGYLITNAPGRALDTLLRLTSVLRGVLQHSSSDFTTLADEIELIRAYLEIEQARFEERLHVVIDVTSNAADVQIPALLLQPLVENAVKHGIGPLSQGGRLSLSATVVHDILLVRITDSGAGCDPTRGMRRGVGLTNVEQRLAAHYGSSAALSIRSTPGAGTSVSVTLPINAAAGRPTA